MKKALVIAGALLGAFFICTVSVYAQWAILLAGQSFKGDLSSYTAGASSARQGIGTGLTGVASSGEMELVIQATGSGNAAFRPVLRECLTAYATCSDVAVGVSQLTAIPVGTTTVNILRQFVTSYTLNPARWYTIHVDVSLVTFTGNYTTSGTTATSPAFQHGTGQAMVSGGGSLTALYYSVIGEFTADGVSIASATSSSIFSGQSASSTLANLADQCSWASNFFAEAICVAFSFLFIPAPATLDNFTQLPEVAAEKFPFSWVFGVKEELNSLTASSTANMTTLRWNLKDLGIGSTTPMGNILPNMVVFGTSTILAYIGQTLWDVFQLLIRSALWLLLGLYLFNQGRRLAQPRV